MVSFSTPLALGLLLMTLVAQCYGNIHVGYYRGKCGIHELEKIVFNVVKDKFIENPDTVSDLIRLQFHDCIVKGCDASVLLDGKNSEKTASPNLSLSGFTVVDVAKAAVEDACPGVVSCADVLIIAARSAVFMAGGKWYEVETGRRDALVSLRSEALANLPPVGIPMDKAVHLFAQKGLTKEDFVVLLGGHTVGSAHCDKIKNRLYNYRNTGKPDGRMNPAFFQEMMKTCPRNSHVNSEAFLDQTPNSHFKIDNAYYQQILANKGVLEVDANMASSPLTSGIVRTMATTPGHFLDKFGPAMVKMGRIGVLTGTHGEIRKSCRAINH